MDSAAHATAKVGVLLLNGRCGLDSPCSQRTSARNNGTHWTRWSTPNSLHSQETVKVTTIRAEEMSMSRSNRAIAAILLTVTTGALAMVDTARADAPAISSPAVAPLTYTVQAGDYLSGIAIRMGVKLHALLDANHLKVTSLIYPGMKLVVPAGGIEPAPKAPTAPAATAPVVADASNTYTVRSGDSLSGIAGRMHVKLSALLAANKLTITSVIHPGTLLIVPAGGVLPSAVVPQAAAAAATESVTAAPLQYVVQPGDYISGIAPALGVRIAELLSVNKLNLSSLIYPGMKLTVPPGGTLPAASAPTVVTPAAGPVATPPATPAVPADSGGTTPDGRIATVITFVQAQLGKPYKAFTAGPDSYDCSGLTMVAYAQIGISLQHYSGSQFTKGTVVDRASQPILAGDLIFLESSVGSGIVSHVGIAINGTQWIQAPRTGDVVRVGNIPTTRVIGIRRILPAT